MVGRINLVGAGEMMASMSSLHRAALARVGGGSARRLPRHHGSVRDQHRRHRRKAIEYYAHHLQTKLAVARFRHKNQPSGEIAAAVNEVPTPT